jgi:uncharacterized protein (TIGR03437 family)
MSYHEDTKPWGIFSHTKSESSRDRVYPRETVLQRLSGYDANEAPTTRQRRKIEMAGERKLTIDHSPHRSANRAGCQSALPVLAAPAATLKPKKSAFLVAIAIVVAAGTAQANLLVNGSFESPIVPAGGFQNFDSGSGGITGWTVTGPAGTNVSVVSGTFKDAGFSFPSEDGSQWLDLTGDQSNNLEGVSQSVSTVAGTTYTLTFWVGNISGLGSTYSSVGLKINGSPAGNFTNSEPGTSMAWQKFTYAFIATSSTTAIEFDNLDPTSDDSNGLDNVDLEEGGTAAPISVNLVTNGDFEAPVIAAGSDLNISTGSSALTGWAVIGTAPLTVALVSGASNGGGFNTTGLTFPAEDGHQWLDLTGTGYSTGTRGITQSVPTIAGMSYLLTFWVGNIFDPNAVTNPGCCNFGTTSTVGVKINGTSAGSLTNSAQVATMNWQQFSITFTAVGHSTEIEFDNLDPATDSSNGLDNVVLQQTPSSATSPSVASNGVVPVYSTATTIQPGEFVSIYGTNLGLVSPAIWTGNFPTSLGGASVTIDGKAAYLLLVDSTQINLQAPDDTATGTVSVVVTTQNGTATSTVTLGEFGPSFSLLDGKHVAGIILRSDGSGAYGGGTYDIVGPTGTSLGYPTVAAKAGDTLELFGVGFGPTNPVVPAGQVYSGAAATTNSVQLLINSAPVLPAFSGLTSAGLYQLNVVQLPAGLGTGDVPLLAAVGGVQTQTGVVISLQ